MWDSHYYLSKLRIVNSYVKNIKFYNWKIKSYGLAILREARAILAIIAFLTPGES